MKNQFRHQFDDRYKGEKGKVMDKTLVTKPDDALDVKQLVANQTNGILSDANKDIKSYTGDRIYPTFDDPVDLNNFKEALALEHKASKESFYKLMEDEKKRRAELKKKYGEQLEEQKKYEQWKASQKQE